MLPAFLEHAIERNLAELEERECSMQPAGGVHRSSCWRLALDLKGHPELRDLHASQVVRLMEQYLGGSRGWRRLPDFDVWGNTADPRADLAAAWGKVTEPSMFVVKPAAAVPLADAHPLDSGRWGMPEDAPYRRTVSLLFWYPMLLDRQEFFLSCRTLGEILGCTHVIANAYLQQALGEDDPGLLVLLEKGSARTRQASQFRFHPDAIEHVAAAPVKKRRAKYRFAGGN